MSRYVIETYTIASQRCTLWLVYNSQGYNDRWMKNSEGRPTIPYVVLENLVTNSMKIQNALPIGFFSTYRKTLGEALYKKLVEIGKADGARLRSENTADGIATALMAIVIEEKTMAGDIKVYCLNKDPMFPVAIYDESMGTVSVENQQLTASRKKKRGNDLKRAFSWSKWWYNNRFLLFVSIFMLIVLPACMIWGMLYIKQKAELSNTQSATELYDAAQPDSTDTNLLKINSLEADSLKYDSTSTEIVHVNH